MNRSIEKKIRPAAIFGSLSALIASFLVATVSPTSAAGAATGTMTGDLGGQTIALYFGKLVIYPAVVG